MEGSLQGKVALVTGAGSGIGRAIAIAYAQAGARVVLSDVDEQGGAETLKLIGNPDAAVFTHADVSSWEDAQKQVERPAAGWPPEQVPLPAEHLATLPGEGSAPRFHRLETR